MPVPEATMDENNLLSCGKHQVRATRQTPVMKAVATPEPMQEMTYDHLGFRVLSANTGHAATSLLGRQNVHHVKILPNERSHIQVLLRVRRTTLGHPQAVPDATGKAAPI